jgi:hypothetical protein
MKKILLLNVLMFLAFFVSGQEYKVAQSTGKLIIKEVDGVKVTGYSGSEIVFNGEVEKDDGEPDRAKGLKMINALGLEDNTGLGISVKKVGGNVIVEKVGNSCTCEIEIKLPAAMSLEYEHSNYNGDLVHIENVSGEVLISAMYNDVKLVNVTGPMSVKSVYGSVEATFSTLSQKGSISIHSIYDFVDVTLPAGAKANIGIETPYGDIYSDVDINVTTADKGMRVISGSKLKGTVNGGGVDLRLTSSYENIYLRKK